MDWGSGITYLARTKFKGQMTAFGIKDADRFEHVCALGRPSSAVLFLAQMALQDIARGVGVVILDATGSLTQTVSERMSEQATKRLIFLDPYDSENPFSWNAVSEFRSLPPTDGIPLLSEAVAALYNIPDSPLSRFAAERMFTDPHATMLLLYELVTDEAARASLGEARALFESLLAENTEASEIISEHGRYLGKDLLIRNLMGQQESKVSLAPIPEGGILIVDMSKIRVYPTRITPLVRLFLHSIRAQARRRNKPVTVFLHECIRYIEPSDVGRLFSERSLAVSFTDSVHSEEDEARRESVLSYTSSVFAFTLSAEDAKAGERIFYPYLAPEELTALPEGEVAVALTVDGVRAKPFLASAQPLPPHQGVSPNDLLIQSRLRYATPRMKVEEALRKKNNETEKDKNKDGDPGSFSDAFRSIFAKGAVTPTPPATPPPTPKPVERVAPAAIPTKTKEISEDTLRHMLYVSPISL